MATSLRPFQSQTMARLVVGYRQVIHSAGRWLRQGRTAAVWGLQVAVYPLYAAVQGMRLGYRQLRAARPWQRVWAPLSESGNRYNQPILVMADTPIRALLSVLQPPVLSSPTVRSHGLRLVSLYGAWLRQSRSGAVLTPGQWHLLPLGAPLRGIASDLISRRLVLVTTDNAIFDHLTEDQQRRLQRAIVLMLAEYARVCRRSALDQHLRQSPLPLPEGNARLVLPLRWLPPLLRWMQLSPLAAATNLFGEARQPATSRAIVRHRRPTSPPPAAPTFASLQSEAMALAAFPSHGPPGGFGHLAGHGLSAATPLDQAIALVVATSSAVTVIDQTPLALVPAAASATLERQVDQSRGVVSDRFGGAIAASPLPATVPVPELAPDQQRLTAPPALEARVTQVNYVDPPLVALLRGLDWVLYVLETWLRGLWAWLQKQW